MTQISSISEFLLQAKTQYRVFDMGRGIRPVSDQTFLDIENGIISAPNPRLQHAWFGVIFFSRELSSEHYIWFVKLPLDEQGLIITATRNHFLQIITDALGQQLEHNKNAKGCLPENPYTFLPNQQQLADFNSISRSALSLPPSAYYQGAMTYFDHPEQHDWQQVPLQGIADVAALVQQENTVSLIINSFHDLASPVRMHLLASLENHIVEKRLSHFIIDWCMANFQQDNQLQHGLRALSQSTDKVAVKNILTKVLQSEHGSNVNTMVLIAARHWQYFCDEDFLALYINQLAEQDSELFISLYADLVQIPSIRPDILAMIRWPQKSAKLTRIIGQIFSGQA
ncbi:MAG: hypothetical protein ACJA13_000064 [Paraglaciecola sp.]|jgi:hypothetical protein